MPPWTTNRTARICAGVSHVVFMYLWLSVLSSLGTIDALTITADRTEVEVNVGKDVSLVWKYSTDDAVYDAILWGKGDKQGINFDTIYYTKKPAQLLPVLSTTLPAEIRSRVKIKNIASLVITNAKLTDEGYYICEIREPFVTFKKKIFLKVYDPATIISHPSPLLEYSEGDNKKIVCRAKGRPKPDVKWVKDGKIIVERKGKVEVVFDPVKDTDMGSYKCFAQNKGGKHEAVTNITVRYKPKGTTFRTDATLNTVSAGSTVNFMCQARGFPTPQYKFYIKTKNNQKQRLNNRNAERSGKMTNVGILDSTFHGTYICIPHNSVGDGPREEVILYVRYPPTITRPPRNVKVNENDFVGVECLADGYPKPDITWVKLTGNKVLNSGDSFSIPSVTRNDQGKYQCIANNSFGKAAVSGFSINVHYPPVINRTISSLRVAAWVGYTATLVCFADGNPQPKYKWTNASGLVSVSEVDGTLDITPTDDNAFGDYTCEASNSRGRDSHTVTLIKVGKPGPVSVEVLMRTRTSLRLQWTVTDSGQSDIKHFTIRYRSLSQDAWTSVSLKAYESEYDLKGLEPFTTYIIKVLASNKYFTSDPTELISKTLEEVPTKPYDVVGFPLNNSAITVKWREPVKKNSDKIAYYTVFYCRMQECNDLLTMPRVSVAHNFTSTTIGGLQAFSNYSIKVRAYNVAGRSESDPIMVTTKMAAPSSPEEFRVNSTGFSVGLFWKRPRKLNGLITKFRVHMKWRLWDSRIYKDEIKEIPAVLTKKAVRNRRSRRVSFRPATVEVLSLMPYRNIRVSGLRPYSQYTLRVSEGTGNEKTGVFWGPYSSGELITMPQGAPSAPEKVKATATGLRSISVSWDKPANPNGRIQQYAIVYSNSSGVNYTVTIRKELEKLSFKQQVNGLRPYTPYTVRVRAYTIYPGPFSAPVPVTTGLKSADVAERKSKDDSGSLFGGVFAGIILFAFVIIIAVLIVRNRRRKRDSTELKGNRYGVANSNDSGIGEKESLDNVPGVKFLHGGRRGSEVVMGPGEFVTIRPIPINKLIAYCTLNHANSNKMFREEFTTMRCGARPSECSFNDDNRPKNRYQNIVAYDDSRVVLSELEGVESSDYINANYIDGYNSRKKFIATQGPVSNTFDDFWRMVWEQSSTVIVMVTNIVERGKVKCLKYWPSTNAEEYGKIVVTPLEEEELSHYVVRKFKLTKSNSPDMPALTVTQYHYTAWPDHGVPSHATSLLAFIRRVRLSVPTDPGPIVVHCSAGVGRTGTYIVLDTMMDQMANENVVDAYGFIMHIRQQRNMMVQTEAQYIFLHDALMEAVKCGTTEFKVQELAEKSKQLQTPDPQTGETPMIQEFKNLDIGDTEVDSFDAASLLENKSKNRHVILPYDRTRVKLWPYAGVIGSDYINASFIDSYQQREAFLATQAPLDATKGEMWRMIWEYETYTMVMLNKDSENDNGQSYLPNKGEFVVYGLLMLEIESREDKDGYSKRHVKITNTKSGESRKIFHFQFHDWDENEVPSDGKTLIDMLKHIARAQQQTGNGPITVHCSDGSGRTGTFCAISIALERVKLDGTIDMFQTVRNLRTQRPLMVQTEEQYMFCYDVVRLFVDAYSDYANFK